MANKNEFNDNQIIENQSSNFELAQKSEETTQPKPRVFKLSVFEIVFIAFCIIFICFSIFLSTTWISVSIVSGSSMETTLHDGDKLITDRLAKVNRGDVIVFKHSLSQDYIKRVIAVEGDSVKTQDGKVYIKRKGSDAWQPLQEDYIKPDTITNILSETLVKKGEYYVLGDNRDVSIDSREIGCIKESQILGVVHEFWIDAKGFTTKLFWFKN